MIQRFNERIRQKEYRRFFVVYLVGKMVGVGLALLGAYYISKVFLGTPAHAADGTDTEVLLPRAVDHGVAYVPGSAFAVPGAPDDERSSLRLSYASLDDDALCEAARRLAAAWGAAA